MIPLLWRFLARKFFQVFSLCILAFISILLVMRLREIAQFASSGAEMRWVFEFTIYQIPYILPIAIPISCLIAALLLMQHLSQTQVLSALRACALGIKTILAPLIVNGSLLFLVSLTVTAEVAPRCKGLAKKITYEIAAINPLFLFQKDALFKLKDAYIDLKTLQAGKSAKEMLLVINNRSNERLGLITAKELQLKGDLLHGKQVSFVSSIDPHQGEEGFDHLIIENQVEMQTKAFHLADFLQQGERGHVGFDYMPLKMLLAKLSLKHKLWHFPPGPIHLEIVRRLSIAFAALTFTLIGATFGIETGRIQTKKRTAWAIGLASTFIIAFLAAKSIRHNPSLSSLLYLLPHPLILWRCWRSLKRVEAGVE